MYLEDVDMSIRARKHNYKLYYVPKAICYHRFHGTAGKIKIKHFYERNRLFVVAKHYIQQLERAIFDNYFFSTIERLNKHFLIAILDEIKHKLSHYSIQIDELKYKIEYFYYKNKYSTLFMPLFYNFVYFTEINKYLPYNLKRFIKKIKIEK